MAAPVNETKTLTPEAIRKMSTPQLTELASAKGVDIAGLPNNPARAEAIIAALDKMGGE
jgi:hypothetical protein